MASDLLSDRLKTSQLDVSTITVMSYANVQFDLDKLYTALPVHEIVDPSLTKKKKLPDFKKIDAPYGKIVSIRHKNAFRGLVKKHIDPETPAKYFLNQLTLIVSLGNCQNVNIFMFKTSFKVTGCRKQSTVERVIKLLWEKINRLPEQHYTMLDERPPSFTFETVMTNVDFSFGFKIDRQRLNSLLNSEQFRNRLKSDYETTSNTNVKVKMCTEKPEGYFYWRHSYTDGKWVRDQVTKIDYVDEKKRKKKEKNTTFLVFHSSKTITSARYADNIEHDYKYFIKVIEDNRDLIEESVDAHADFVF